MLTPIFRRFCAQIVFESVVRHHGPRHQQRQVINIVEEIHGEGEEGLRATSRILSGKIRKRTEVLSVTFENKDTISNKATMKLTIDTAKVPFDKLVRKTGSSV